MSITTAATEIVYKKIVKPILFKFDEEQVHSKAINTGKLLNKSNITDLLFNYKNTILVQNINGIEFKNPIGLAAGFDYNGILNNYLNQLGFGFSTVGTVTYKNYTGNTPPRLVRLPESKALLVNKGFKSQGAQMIYDRLKNTNLLDSCVGVSIGSSNLPEVNTLQKAIDDYIQTFKLFSKLQDIKYFELNISCPNTIIKESFAKPQNFEPLLSKISQLNVSKPIFVKMPNEISIDDNFKLIDIALKYKINTFIFSNLVKNRANNYLSNTDRHRIQNLKGNISGKPAFENSTKLISQTRSKFKKDVNIIGCGGIFTFEDALIKLQSGADLLQLITGMIYEGPQIASNINQKLVKYCVQKGYSNINQIN